MHVQIQKVIFTGIQLQTRASPIKFQHLLKHNLEKEMGGVRELASGSTHVHRYHTVFLPSDVFRRILSQMRKNKKTEDRDGQFVY